MANPPKVFISATSGDLRSARQIVKDALLTINCHPVEQTNFEPDYRTIADMLRGKISDCQALIHIAGNRYGAEPDPATLPPGTDRHSYTQMEYHIARQLGLRVYTFVLPDTYPYDVPTDSDGQPVPPEAPEKTALQQQHRDFIRKDAHIRYTAANDLELRTHIIALQEKVIGLEQEQVKISAEVKTTRHWGIWATAAILLLLACIGVWQMQAKKDTTHLAAQMTQVQEALSRLQQQTDPAKDPISQWSQARLEEELARQMQMSVTDLRALLHAGRTSLDALVQGQSLLASGKPAEAGEKFDQVLKEETGALQRAKQAWEGKAQIAYDKVRYEEAFDYRQKAAALVDKTTAPLAWADAQTWVTVIQFQLARHQDAEPLMREILTLREQHLGPDHPMIAIALNDLAQLLQATNRLGEAEPLMVRALKMDEASYGRDHPHVTIRLNNLAQLLKDTNRQEEAEPMLQRALKISEASYGPDHPDIAIRLNNLASLLRDTNGPLEAEQLYRRALKINEVIYGPDHPEVATILNNLASLLQDTNRLPEAELLMERSLKISEASYGPDHPDVAIRLISLAYLYQTTGRLKEAEPLLRRALKISEASYGPDHPQVAAGLNILAALLNTTNRMTEAEPLLRQTVGIFLRFQTRTGHRHSSILTALENYLVLTLRMDMEAGDIRGRLDTLRAEVGLTPSEFQEILAEVVAKLAPEVYQVVIKEVVKGGQGDTVGLQAGDVYLSYQGQAITSADQLIKLTSEEKGETIPLEVRRGEAVLKFTLKPGKLGTRIENRPLPSAEGKP